MLYLYKVISARGSTGLSPQEKPIKMCTQKSIILPGKKLPVYKKEIGTQKSRRFFVSLAMHIYILCPI